ncbi:MAG: hypothetical protein LUG18_09500 [Candidatus Azobacteroides sp.]|nr:hypothetical protein [Candidatus Azobacteroides sp.]
MLLNRIIANYLIALAALVMLPVLCVSCDDDDDKTGDEPGQLFRPVLFSVESRTEPVILTWVPIKDASYLMEISRDSLKFEVELQRESLQTGTKELELSGLMKGERYSARIKSISNNPAIRDSEFATLSFVAP